MSRRVTLGDSSESPAATTLTARTSSTGSVSLMRKPLAPARRASTMYSSSSKVVRISTRTASRAGSSAIRRVAVDAADLGHLDVHEHHVGPFRPGELDRLAPVGGLADHLDAGLGVEQHVEPGTHQGLVVGHGDADHSGSRASTR